jgi:hypothetical protein
MTFGYLLFFFLVIGCNQPQQRPGGRKFGDRLPPGQFPKNQIYKGGNVENKIDTQKIIQRIITLLGRATDKQLRIIYQVAYEIVKKA